MRNQRPTVRQAQVKRDAAREQRIADLIESALGYTNGWRVSDEQYRSNAEDAAVKILRYLKRARALRA